MQLTSLYTRYFQKSKSFLYPLLGIAKGAYAQPMQTYICMKHHSGLEIKPKDKKLICLFEDTNSDEFKAFEQAYLVNNPYYLETIPGPMSSKLYIFSLKKHTGDWNKFLKGKYSQFSNLAKVKIKEYYGHHTLEYTYMRCRGQSPRWQNSTPEQMQSYPQLPLIEPRGGRERHTSN